MRRTAVAAAIVLGVGVVLAEAQDASPAPAQHAAGIARRLLSGEKGPASREEREGSLRDLNAEYEGVKDAVLEALRRAASDATSATDHRSRLDCAIALARRWRIREAQGALVALVKLQINPMSVPRGVQMVTSSFYPAVEALAAVAGPPEPLLRAMTEDNSPFVLWAMTETYGRNGTITLMRDCKELKGFDAALLDKAIVKVQSVEHTSDLLPPVLSRK